MSNTKHPNIPNLIMMVRPKHFGFNHETAGSNSFQNDLSMKNVSEKAKAEFDQMTATLRLKGVDVKVFEDQDIFLPDAVFPNNWISHIPGGPLVIYPMLTPNRRAEVRSDIVDWCVEQLNPAAVLDMRDVAVSSEFLEGTGSIVFDHDTKTAFACVSPRTNLGLLSALASKINYNVVSFESLDVKGQQIYHTNVMMSIGKEVVLVCLESLENMLERLMLKEVLAKSGKRVVELSRSQTSCFAGNALEVCNVTNQRFFLMSETAYQSLDPLQVKSITESAEIVSFSIPTIEQIGGGSVRCMLAGFFNYPR